MMVPSTVISPSASPQLSARNKTQIPLFQPPIHRRLIGKIPAYYSGAHFNHFINDYRIWFKSLPESVPQASEFDKLAVFGGSPMEFDDAAWMLMSFWETKHLNGVLKLALGWGTEGNMDEIVRHGKWGLDGLVNFVTYFVEERGVSEGTI